MECDQNPIRQATIRNETSALRAQDASGMGFINDHLSAVLFREENEIGDRRTVAIHAENAFADDEFLSNSGKSRAGEILTHFSLKRIHIAMRENYFARTGDTQSIDDAGMVGAVGKDDVAWANQSAQETDIRGI